MRGIKRCRRAAGLSVDELAVRLGVTRQCVYLWESGERLPAADKLPEIARVLGCSIDELFREESADCHGPQSGPRNDKEGTDSETDCHVGLCPPRNDKGDEGTAEGTDRRVGLRPPCNDKDTKTEEIRP